MKLLYSFAIVISLLTLTFFVLEQNGSGALKLFKSKTVNSQKVITDNNEKSKTVKNRISHLKEAGKKQISSTFLNGVPFVPTISAIKTVDKTTGVVAGDVLTYNIIIANDGSESANNLSFLDDLDENTTLVSGSLKTSPIAFDDVYDCLGNVGISVPEGSGILANDERGAGIPATFVAVVNDATTQGGVISIGENGSFNYTPAAGFTGEDTYDYTLTNDLGSSNATITITVEGMIWFIDNSYGGSPTDGRLATPFKTITAFQAVNDGVGLHPKANENIFVYESSSSYDGNITLLDGQKLIGQDATTTLAAITGITPPPHSSPALPSMNSSNATIVTLTATGSTNVISLNGGSSGTYVIRGLTIGNKETGSGIFGTDFGTATVSETSIYGTGQALNLSGGTITATFPELSASSGNKGLSLINIAGTVTINSGAISGTDATAFSIGSGSAGSGGSCSVTFNGTISKDNTGRAIEIQNKTAGMIAFNDDVSSTSTSAGILLDKNTGAVIDFAGGLNLSTTTNTAFSATGGGTVTVKQTASIINTITTTTGTALNVTNTTIGAIGLTFRSISVNGASKGIILNNTGAGAFTITGEGTTAGSGGTIQNISQRAIEITGAQNINLKNLAINNGNTGDGGFAGVCDEINNTGCYAAVYITNTSTVSLDRINIVNTAEQGINLNNITGLSITNCNVEGNGNEAEEGALKFRNIKGTCTISGSTFKNSAYRIAHIINTEGNLQLSVTNSSFINEAINLSAIKQDCFEMRAQSTATATVLLTNCTFKRAGTKGIQIAAENTANVSLAITGCTVDREGTLMAGIEVISDQTAVMNANIDGNPLITGDREVPLNIYSGLSSTMQGTARNNPIITGGNNPLLNSYATLRAYAAEQSNSKVLFSNNTVAGTDEEGILVASADGVNTGSINATVDANTVTTNPLTVNTISLRSVAISGPANSNCSHVKGNTVIAVAPTEAFTIATGSPTSKIELQSNSGAAVADLESIWNNNSNMPAAPPSTVLALQTPGSTITYGGVTCLLPTNLVAPTIAFTSPTEELINAVNDLKEDSNVMVNAVAQLNENNPEEEPDGIQPSDTVIRQTNNIESYAQEIQSIVTTTSSQNVTISGITLPPSESMVITFQVTVNDPLSTSACAISNQGSVSGSEITTVLTDNDDNEGNGINPTVSVIKDITGPVVSNCPGTVTVQTGAGNTDCTQTATWTEPTATDNCTGGPLTYSNRSHQPGDVFEKGTTAVTYTFTDDAGNESTCSFNVVVQDNTPPVLTCPSNVTAEAACGSSSAVVTYPDATASDNCPGMGTIQYSKASGTSFPLGTTTVNVNVTDAAGKTSTCSFTVTVNQAPNCNSNVLEAELALLNKVVVASNHPGYTGNGFGDFINASGDYIEWTLDVPGGGLASLKFRYANGSGSNRPLRLQINGQVINSSLAFAPTGGWNKWSMVTVSSNLLCGVNKIRLTAIGSSGANIDHLAWSVTTPGSGTLQAEAALLNKAVAASNHSGYTGTGFVDYINASGDYIEWTVYKSGGGSTNLKFRYANGAANRPLRLTINGTIVVSSLSFPSTGAWTNWSTVAVTRNLACGVNKIRLTAIGSSGANIDRLEWSAASSSTDMLESNEIITEVEKGALSIKVFPNPAPHHFNLRISSSSDKPVSLRVIDAFGRIVEVRQSAPANGTLQFGQLYKAGMYYVEIIQGTEKRTIKLMKSRS